VRKTLIIGAAVAAIAVLGLAGPAEAHGGSHGHHSSHRTAFAEVSLFHGIPNTPVDVYIGGHRVLDNFQPGTFAGPFDVKAGTYSVAITAADATNANDPVIGPVDVTVAAKKNYTIAAHLTAAGAPTATVYTNTLGSLARKDGRLTVRHVAAAPAVDVLASGTPVISGLTNPAEKSLVLRAATVSASVALAGTTTPVLGPVDLKVRKGVTTIVYAYGSAADGTLALAVQRIGSVVHGRCHTHAAAHGYHGSYGSNHRGWSAKR
jgi:hypothetical protein